MQKTEPLKTSPIDDLETLPNEREQAFALYYLASQNPTWSAGRAGYHGDLAKRSRTLLKHPELQTFLKKYSPPPSESQVEITKDSVLLKLAQIASGQLVKINTSDILKALELIGRHLGMFDGIDQQAGRDRLAELVAVFRAGAVKKEEEV